MEQTVEFQSFRMRTFEVRGKGPCLLKGNSFMFLKSLNVMVQRFRSKAFSPACLFRFSESSAPLPKCDTVSEGERTTLLGFSFLQSCHKGLLLF
jgi:hypothetical protein